MPRKVLIVDDEPNIVVSLRFPDEEGGVRDQRRP